MSNPTDPRCPVCGAPVEIDEDGQPVCLGDTEASWSAHGWTEPAENPLMAQVVYALRLLGAENREHAAEILNIAGTHLSDRERTLVLDRIGGGQ